MAPDGVRQKIEQIVAEVAATSPADDQVFEIVSVLRAMPGVDLVDDATVYDHEYEIEVGSASNLQDTIDALERVRGLSLSCAPELVAVIPIGPEGWDVVLITRYSACPGERLREIRREDRFSLAAAQRFRADMRKLAAKGLVHQYADLGETSQWLMSSETKTLLLTSWDCIEEAQYRDIQRMLESVDEILALHGGLD